ncbi:hypothetical protein [Agrobacterium radiobacter]|uniref:hypothetical protein n=1 Tax=Agrobacterium radiobacter TaxID=362 RepID=UPI003CF247A2
MTDKVYDQREDLYAAGYKVSGPHFINVFTGEAEPYLSEGHVNARMFLEAHKRITELQEEIRQIKAFLVL